MKFSRALRRDIFQKYGGFCAYCGQPLKLEKFQIDHIQPLPVNHKSFNLNPSCRYCNSFKSNLSLEDFRRKIALTAFMTQFKTPHIDLLFRYDLIQFNTRSVIFYFEKTDHNCQSCGMELKK
jgi:hypothetical protein